MSTSIPRSAGVRRLRLGAPACVGAILLAACGGGGDDAAPAADAQASIASAASCANRSSNNFNKLLECVTLAGVRAHQAALQAIADANGGTRAAGTPGYDASVEYVRQKLAAAGYLVTLHAFPFVFVPPPTLRQLAPVAATYETGTFTGTG